jgi:hypothetical protein
MKNDLNISIVEKINVISDVRLNVDIQERSIVVYEPKVALLTVAELLNVQTYSRPPTVVLAYKKRKFNFSFL